jgi:hypothetical protein
MLVDMRSIVLKGLSALLCVCSGSSHAGLYKGLDDEGNVIYSDVPVGASEQYTPPSISVVGKTKAAADKPVKDDGEENAPVFKYSSFDIVSPPTNQTILRDVDITVTLRLTPGLNTKKEDSIWMLVDGEPRVEDSRDLSIPLGKLDPGVHKLQAQIRDTEGRIVARTRTTVIFVYQLPGK